MSTCIVCGSHEEEIEGRKRSFHSFPLNNKRLLKKWVEFVGRKPSWAPDSSTKICSIHFLQSDFIPTKSPTKHLKYNGVPTIKTTSATLGIGPVPEESARSMARIETVDPDAQGSSGSQKRLLESNKSTRENSGAQYARYGNIERLHQPNFEKCIVCDIPFVPNLPKDEQPETTNIIRSTLKILEIVIPLEFEEISLCPGCLRRSQELISTQASLEKQKDNFTNTLIKTFIRDETTQCANQVPFHKILDKEEIQVKIIERLVAVRVKNEEVEVKSEPLSDTWSCNFDMEMDYDLDLSESRNDFILPDDFGGFESELQNIVRSEEQEIEFHNSDSEDEKVKTTVRCGRKSPKRKRVTKILKQTKKKKPCQKLKHVMDAERWEILSKCPETSFGIERILPFDLQKVNCPVCNESMVFSKITSHLKSHVDVDKENRTEIRAKLFEELKKNRVTGSERERLVKERLKKYEKYRTERDETGKAKPIHIPEDIKLTNCPTCGKQVGLRRLASHMTIHTGERPFKCSLCPKTFARESNLFTHRGAVHSTKDPYKSHSFFCDFCSTDRMFCRRTRFVNHVLDIHARTVNQSEGLYFHNCDMDGCKQSFRQVNNLVEHLKSHSKTIYSCPESKCPKVFASLTNYEEHCGKIHSENSNLLNCKYCPLIFDTQEELDKHESTHGIFLSVESEQRLQHLCELCGKGFKSNLKLNVHRNKHKKELKNQNNLTKLIEGEPTEEPKEFLCEECGKAFANSAALGSHKLSHNLQKSKLVSTDEFGKLSNAKNKQIATNQEVKSTRKDCHLCEKNFCANRVLINHLLDFHTYEQKMECYLCGDKFIKYACLLRHIRKHLGQPRIIPVNVCFYCPEEFASPIIMRRHCVTNHSEIHLNNNYPFHCPVCWHRYQTQEERSSHHLDKHERWKCKVCGKQLANRFLYDYHMSNHHGGEKLFKCDICLKSFPSAPNLKEHLMRHKKEKPFYCEQCPTRPGFYRKKALKEHMETVHIGDNV